MARTNLAATRVKPDTSQLLTLHVLRREAVSPGFVRVTLGGGDIAAFRPMGFDQWFRLFLPVKDAGELTRLPDRLGTLEYLRYLTISKAQRPVLRSYTVRAFRPEGPHGAELDVDLVIHGSVQEGTAGPAALWAQACAVGDAVAVLDEGIGFNPPPGTERLMLVADETGLPAVAGILGSLPHDAVGTVHVEVPTDEDRQELDGPPGMAVTWVRRERPGAVPGATVRRVVEGLPVPVEQAYGWVVGEQALATGVRRHWVATGLAKDRIMFCGYWRSRRHD